MTTRSHRRRGVRLALAPALMLAAAVPANGTAVHHPKPRKHTCGAYAVPAHRWQNIDHGRKAESGDHWIVTWQGLGGSCKVARRVSRGVIAHPRHTIRGGACEWDTRQSPGVAIHPFHIVRCAMGRTRTHVARFTVVTFVDPDPRFIRPGPAA